MIKGIIMRRSTAFLCIVVPLQLSAMELKPKKKKKSKKDDASLSLSPPVVMRTRILPEECLALITHFLCVQKPAIMTEKIKDQHIQDRITDIKHFSWVNQQSYHYHHRNGGVKEMIKKIAVAYDECDLSIATLFPAPHIRARLFDLLDKIRDRDEVFSPQDLQDPWYLNATFDSVIYSTPIRLQTLLFMAVWKGDEIKVETLIKAGADYQAHKLIALLAHKEHGWFLIQPGNFKILELLLACNEDPDSRYSLTSLTLLQAAALYDDKKLARLVLSYGANPWKAHVPPRFIYEEPIDDSHISLLYDHRDKDAEPWKENAFTLEKGKPKGWLMTMYEKIQQKRAFKTILSPADQSAGK
jgi:hypothetical protein